MYEARRNMLIEKPAKRYERANPAKCSERTKRGLRLQKILNETSNTGL